MAFTDWVPASNEELKSRKLYGVRGWLILFVIVAIAQAMVGIIRLWGTTTVTTTLESGQTVTGTLANQPVEGLILLLGGIAFLWFCLTKSGRFFEYGAAIVWLPWILWTASWLLTEPAFSLIATGENGDVIATDDQSRNALAETLDFFSAVFSALWFVYAVVVSVYIRRSKRVRMTFLKMKPPET